MAVLNVSPTRMELIRVKGRYAAAVKGHKLLKDKRDELMRQFLDIVRETRELRRHAERKMTQASRGFAFASSVMQREALASALMTPKNEAELAVASKNVMGVDVPVFTIRGKTDDGAALTYGYAFTCGDLDTSVTALKDVLPDLLRLAQQEKTLQMLAIEIEKTRRRVNALEHVLMPNYRDTIQYITMKLVENERGSLIRLMKVKDMMMKRETEAGAQPFELG
ncbi:MAG: V-type ATP synthase subunit D [Clostridia bacterium]|nr:V-type ATP synthase subunit D [Clostridia bacterium]